MSVASMGKRERSATTRAFALFLIEQVTERCGKPPVSALWVHPRTIYRVLGLDCWDEKRDARLFQGPGPVIAHPPCGPWGKYWAVSKEDPQHAIIGLEMVQKYGGVLEHPVGSVLFEQMGVPYDELYEVNQGDYGHRAVKPTLLYFSKGEGNE